MYSEIKYDGERVQVHKNGDHFSYFSRSLKPVLPHKVCVIVPTHTVQMQTHSLLCCIHITMIVCVKTKRLQVSPLQD